MDRHHGTIEVPVVSNLPVVMIVEVKKFRQLLTRSGTINKTTPNHQLAATKNQCTATCTNIVGLVAQQHSVAWQSKQHLWVECGCSSLLSCMQYSTLGQVCPITAQTFSNSSRNALMVVPTVPRLRFWQQRWT